MKRGITAALAAALLVMSLGACCRNTEHNTYKEIYKRYNNMESFSATVQITVQNGQTEHCYSAEQYYIAPDKFAMTVTEPEAVSGSGYVFDGDTVLLKSGFGHGETLEGISVRERSSVALSDFFEEYYKSEETAVVTEKSLAGDDIRMDCFLQEKNKQRYMQSLWIDNDTYLPLRLVTYDVDEQPVVIVVFRKFERDCKIEEKKFE